MVRGRFEGVGDHEGGMRWLFYAGTSCKRMRGTDRWPGKIDAASRPEVAGPLDAGAADLEEVRQRRRARREDLLSVVQDTGRSNRPSARPPSKQVGCAVVMLAAQITAWTVPRPDRGHAARCGFVLLLAPQAGSCVRASRRRRRSRSPALRTCGGGGDDTPRAG